MFIYKNWNNFKTLKNFVLDVHEAGCLLGFKEVQIASSVLIIFSNSTPFPIFLLIREEKKKKIT